jgi:hypothetical protein
MTLEIFAPVELLNPTQQTWGRRLATPARNVFPLSRVTRLRHWRLPPGLNRPQDASLTVSCILLHAQEALGHRSQQLETDLRILVQRRAEVP